MITVERMKPEHVSRIVALEKECFSLPWSEKSIASELDNRLSLWLVAMDGQTLAGYIGSQTVMGEADMMNVAVESQYRRKGIAEQLVLSLIEALKEKDATQLTLEVRTSNAPAISLYEKLGFVCVGKRPNYYKNPKEDALILRKTL